jgi:hypothetical protein
MANSSCAPTFRRHTAKCGSASGFAISHVHCNTERSKWVKPCSRKAISQSRLTLSERIEVAIEHPVDHIFPIPNASNAWCWFHFGQTPYAQQHSPVYNSGTGTSDLVLNNAEKSHRLNSCSSNSTSSKLVLRRGSSSTALSESTALSDPPTAGSWATRPQRARRCPPPAHCEGARELQSIQSHAGHRE